MKNRKLRCKLFCIAIIIIILGISYTLFWLRRYNSPQIFGDAILRIETENKVVALTFDDGPNPNATLDILEILNKYNAYATFFLIGENIEKYPDIVKEIIINGHEIGNHSYNHERLIFRPLSFIRNQIETTDNLIRTVGYEGEIYFRAPYGNKLFILSYYLMINNRKHILYNIVLNDWESPSPENMMKTLDQLIEPGAIILLHDGYTEEPQSREATITLVELILEKYSGMGYRFVTISELLDYR